MQKNDFDISKYLNKDLNGETVNGRDPQKAREALQNLSSNNSTLKNEVDFEDDAPDTTPRNTSAIQKDSTAARNTARLRASIQNSQVSLETQHTPTDTMQAKLKLSSLSAPKQESPLDPKTEKQREKLKKKNQKRASLVDRVLGLEEEPQAPDLAYTKKHKKKIGKKGCFFRCLTILGILALIVCGALLVFFSAEDQRPTDAKFESLINQTFNTLGFADTLTNQAPSLGTKLRTATNTTEITDDNGNLNYAIFLASQDLLINPLSLNRYDLGNLITQLNAVGSLSGSGVSEIIGNLKAHQFNYTLGDKTMTYQAIYALDTTYLSQKIKMEKIPEIIYFTISATLDLKLSADLTLKTYTFTINNLNSSDSDYCINTLLSLSKAQKSEITVFPLLPLTHLNSLATLWNTPFTFSSDLINFTPAN